jgi:cell division protein FtsL
MSRLNILLLIVVLSCALSVVNGTNQQRRFFVQLERAQADERQLQLDYAQLQYEQSALSKTSRIEQLATDTLKMQPIASGSTQYLTLAPGASEAQDAAISTAASTPATATVRAEQPGTASPSRGGPR